LFEQNNYVLIINLESLVVNYCNQTKLGYVCDSYSYWIVWVGLSERGFFYAFGTEKRLKISLHHPRTDYCFRGGWL